MSAGRRVAALALIATVASCSGDSGPDGAGPGADAAAALERIADSVNAAGGSSADAASLRAAAEFIRLGGEPSQVVIAVDGRPAQFHALAAEVVLASPDCPEPATAGAPDRNWIDRCWWFGGRVFRTLVAWDEQVTRILRIVAGVSPVESTPSLDPSDTGPRPWRGLFATFFERGGGAWWAVDGKLESELLGTDGPCDDLRMRPLRDWDSCEKARSSFAFDLLLAPIVWYSGSPTGPAIRTLTLAMEPSEIRGVKVTIGPSPVTPIPLPPPDSVRPIPPPMTPTPPRPDSGATGNLITWLEATPEPDGSVALALRIRNPRSTPVQLDFTSGQRYDFEIRLPDSTRIWRWSDDKAFTMVLGTETLAPGETRAWIERWESGGRTGEFTAFGRVATTSQPLSASAPFRRP